MCKEQINIKNQLTILSKVLNILKLFCFGLLSFSQIKGKIVDSQTGVAITNVSIRSDDNKIQIFSDVLGWFEVKTIGVYTFKILGY